MKILLVLHHHLDPNAGAADVTLKLGEAYQKLGHDVYYCSHGDYSQQISGKLLSILFPLFVFWHIWKLSKKVKLDVIHASTGDAWVWGTVFGRLSTRRRPLLITQSHGLEHTMHEKILEDAKNGTLKISWKYPLYNGSLMLWQVAKSFQTADFCFMLNYYDAEVVRKKIGVAYDKVRVFRNAIPDYFLGLPFEDMHFSENLPGIAIVGSYIERKGIQYGVPALDALMRRHLDLQIKFLGVGCSPKKVLADFSPELRDRVTVISKFNKFELPRLLEGCQILLFPSLSEGFPLALPEAMACGLAPIVTRIPGSTDIVIDRQNGLVIDPRSQSQIEQAIEALLSDSRSLRRYRTSAYETVQSFRWLDIANQHLSLYRDCLNIPEKQSVPLAY
jgi:glycosyltransferase involved in cell wall biosynthesis